MNKPRVDKSNRTRATKKSKPDKLRLMAKHTGIEAYEKLAELATNPHRTVTKREGIDRQAAAHQKKGTLQPSFEQKRFDRLDVGKTMEGAFKSLRRDQPKWKIIAKGWDLFYDYLTPHIQSDIGKMPLLKEILAKRKAVYQIGEAMLMNGRVTAGDVQYCITWAKRAHTKELFTLRRLKTKMRPEDYFNTVNEWRAKQLRLNRLEIQLRGMPTGKELNASQRAPIRVHELTQDALSGNLHVLGELVGVREAKLIRKAENFAYELMKVWTR